MPDPIIEPITIIVASIGPSARTSPLVCGAGSPSGRIRRAFRREGARAPVSLSFLTTSFGARLF